LNASPTDGPVEPPDGDASAGQAGATLSRELGEFLIELSIAIHHHGMYPAGHPSLEPAGERVTDRVTYLLKKRATLSLGVAKDQLVIEGVATDTNNPLLRELAGRLHRHHLGAVSFHQGVSKQEILPFLTLMAEEPDQTGEPLGLGPRERREQQPNIRMHPVAYDSLRLIDDDGTVDEDSEARSARTRYAQLWVGLARAAVVQEESDEQLEADADGDPDDVSHDPVVVAQAISEHSESDAYDQVVVGYLLQIADELQTASSAEAVQLNQRMAQLVSAMEPDALSRLLKMGGDGGQRHEFLLNASRGLKSESVLRLVEAASESEEQQVSDHLLRMLGKLSQHADSAGGKQGQYARESLQEQVSDLVTDWALTDPNPDAYTSALSEMATTRSQVVTDDDRLSEPESKRIVDMALELDLVGDSVAEAVNQLIETDETPWLLERITDNESSALTQSLIGSTEEFGALLKRLLDSELVDPTVLDTLLGMAGNWAVEPMMEALDESESRHVRRLLLDRLVTMQSEVASLAIQRLDDPRADVTRNMLWLLNGADEVPEEFVPDAYLQHEDHRVRYEAVRLCNRLEGSREKGITRGLTDEDEKTVRFALTAALEDCPGAALPFVMALASSGSTDVRVLAIRVLASVRNETVVPTLLGLTEPKRRLFRWKHPPKDLGYLAALSALHSYSGDGRVRTVLDLAGRRRDPEIAEAAKAGGAADD
jgi:hypothetical protein